MIAAREISSPPESSAPPRFRLFLGRFTELVTSPGEESSILAAGAPLLRELVAVDDWLPASFAKPDPERYQQYLLYRDPRDRFSVVSFVWGPGQATPIHDHRVWGLVGVLRGAERVERFGRDGDGGLRGAGPPDRLEAGTVEGFGPLSGDIHRVSNAFEGRSSISIHVYGADIGKVHRAAYDSDGREKPFISGYSNTDALISGDWREE